MKKILFLSIALILVAGVVSLAKSADIDTSVNESQSTGYAKDRHMVKASDGQIVILYQGGSSPLGIRARKSDDNGATWENLSGGSDSTQISSSTSKGFSICLAANGDDIYVTYEGSNNIYFKKLTYSGGNWSRGDESLVDGENDNANPSIILQEESPGYYYIWVAYGHDTEDGALVRAKYVDAQYDFNYPSVGISTVSAPVATANPEDYYPALTISYDDVEECDVPFIAYQSYQGLYDIKWSKWDDYEVEWPSTAAISGTLADGFSITRKGDDVHLVCRHPEDGIKYSSYTYTTSSWSTTPEILSTGEDAERDRFPSLTTDDTDLWCFASIYYEPNKYNIKYRHRQGTTWGSWKAVTTDNAKNLYSTIPSSCTAYIPLAWTYGTASPYTVKFYNVFGADIGNRYWVGATNWNNTNNWAYTSGGLGGASVPDTDDTAIFDGGGTNSCYIDISATAASVIIYSTYTAIVSINSGKSLTTSGSFEIAGGTFAANGGLLEVGSYSQSGGIFNAGASTVTCSGNFYMSGGTFNAGTSVVTLNGSSLQTITSGGNSFYDLKLEGSGAVDIADDLSVTNDFTNTTHSGSFSASTHTVTNTVTIGNDFQFNSGALYLGNGSTWTVAGNWDMSSADYWYRGTSTVVLTDTGTLNVSSLGLSPFYNLKAAAAGKTTTLQNHVRVANILTLGTGTLTDGDNSYDIFLMKGEGTPLVNDGATITVNDFSYTCVLNSTVTVTGGNYGPLNSLRLSGALNSTFNLGGDITVDGTFRLFTWPSFTVCNTQNNNLTATGLSLGDDLYNESVIFNCGSSTMTIGTDGLSAVAYGGSHTLNLSSATVTCAGVWKLVDGSGSITQNPGISSVTLDGSSGTQEVISYGQSFYNLTINNTGASVELQDGLDVDGDLTITQGTLDTNSGENNPINVAGNWTFEGGAFECRQSTVTFDNASSTSTLTGSTTFYVLVSTATGKTVKFSSNTTTYVTGHLNFEDIILRSTLQGATWYLNLNPSATQDVSGVNVQDSNASDGETIVAANSIDSGNNTNWDFEAADGTAPAAITDLTGLCNSDTGDVTLSWSTPGDDEWTSTLPVDSGYRIDYSTDSTKQWDKDDYEVWIPTSGVAPHTEVSYKITGLTGDSTWYFQIWTRDEVPNWSGLSNGATIYVNTILSVSISTNTYNFGEVPVGASTHTVSIIAVTNEGNVKQTYSLKISSVVLSNGDPSLWEVGTDTDTAPANDKFLFYSIFHGTNVALNYFKPNDITTEANQVSTSERFTYEDDGPYKQTGENVPPGEERKLWFRLDMPTGVTTAEEEKITITISAEKSP